MFDIQKILSRSWHILWSYRLLWVFGFLLALATGGDRLGSGSNYSIGDSQTGPSTEFQPPGGWEGLEGETFGEKAADLFRWIRTGFESLQEQYPIDFRMAVTAIVTLIVVVTVAGILVAVLRYVAETAAVRMVDEYEGTGVKVGFRQAWRYGWNRDAWRLFLANLLVNLPVMALLVLLILIGWWIFSAFMGGVEAAIITSMIAGIGLAFLSIFFTAILMAFLYVLRDFAWRMIVLEGRGVREGLGLSWALIRREWKNVDLMWLVMFGLKIGWAIAFFFLIFPLLVISFITAVGGVVVALLPSLLTAAVAGLLAAPEYWPWVFAGIVGAPIFLIIAFSPVFLVSGWWEIYNSSVWTLAYRELKALETVAVEEAAA